MDIWNLRGRRLTYLASDEIERLHEASLSLLERTGCVFHDERALVILRPAGARVDDQPGRAWLPRPLVEQAVGCRPRAATDPRRGRGPNRGRVRRGVWGGKA
jgi:trimethylamine--corrinoid protein Co-methyltransferase